MGSRSASEMDAPNAPIIRPIRLAHVVLRSSKRDRLRDFYLTFLGAKVQFQNETLCFITYDEEHHRIAIVEILGTADKIQQSCGLEHIAFTYANLTELMLSYQQKLHAGIKPFWCVNHGPTISMYYKDPDGNVLETQVDNFDDAESANRFMEGPEFKENPLGVDFDPAQMIERLKNGESEVSLKHRPNIGPRELPTFMI